MIFSCFFAVENLGSLDDALGRHKLMALLRLCTMSVSICGVNWETNSVPNREIPT